MKNDNSGGTLAATIPSDPSPPARAEAIDQPISDGIVAADHLAPGLVIREATLQPLHTDAAELPPSATGPVKIAIAANGVVGKILDATRSLIGIKDHAGRYLLINKAMAEFHGLSRSAFIGRTSAEIGLTGTAAWADPPNRPSSEREALVRHSVELTDATGRRRRFDIAYQTAKSTDSGAEFLLEVATETNELDLLTDRVPPSLLAAIPAASFRCEVRPKLRVTLVDAAAASFFGVPASELLGNIEKLLTYAHDGAVEPRRQRWQGLAEHRHAWDEELEILNARGEQRWLRIASQPTAGYPNEYRGLIVDITTSKRAQTTEAGNDQRLELALANGGLGLVDWHIESGRLAPDKQLAKLLELDDGEFMGSARELSCLEHAKDKERIYAELQAHLHGRTSEFRCEYRLRTARGRVRWVLANGRVVHRGPDGRALRYLGTLQDVTDPLTTEQELEQQGARLQAATRVSSELAREVKQLETEIREISHREQERIGHDLHDGLGQELTGVSLLLKTLEQAIEREAPQLSPRVRSVRDLVEQCLATTRALAQGLSPVHLDRDGFAGALEQLAATSASFYGIPVKFSCQRSGVSPERGAATDLYRIAQEAISNAAKHSGAREIKLRLLADMDRIMVTVEDDGQGIAEGAALKGGMGLKIMRYRATIIGAALDIVSREGGGTVVRCTLCHPIEGVA